MSSSEEREAFLSGEALAVPCAGNPTIGNDPGHVVNVVTQASDVGQWMSLVDASNRYPVLRMVQGGGSDLCHNCSSDVEFDLMVDA